MGFEWQATQHVDYRLSITVITSIEIGKGGRWVWLVPKTGACWPFMNESNQTLKETLRQHRQLKYRCWNLHFNSISSCIHLFILVYNWGLNKEWVICFCYTVWVASFHFLQDSGHIITMTALFYINPSDMTYMSFSKFLKTGCRMWLPCLCLIKTSSVIYISYHSQCSIIQCYSSTVATHDQCLYYVWLYSHGILLNFLLPHMPLCFKQISFLLSSNPVLS